MTFSDAGRKGELILNPSNAVWQWLTPVLFSITLTACNPQIVDHQDTVEPITPPESSEQQQPVSSVKELAKELPVILFTSGSVNLDAKARKQIHDIATLINNPELASTTITLNGHSDTNGDASWNLVLSRRRAEAVSRELMLNGVRGNRLEINALGESQPLFPEQTPDGRYDANAANLNRRVEISVQHTE